MKIIIHKHNYMIQILYNKHWYLHVHIEMLEVISVNSRKNSTAL